MYCEGGEAWEQVAWRFCGCLVPASVQGQTDCGPDLVEGVCGREVGRR